MKKATVILLVLALVMLILGSALVLVPIAKSGWDFSKLESNRYQTKTHEITDDFTNIYIDIQTADVAVLPSSDGGVRVVSHERINATNEVKVQEDTLSIALSDHTEWYDRISLFGFGEPSITIYLPVGDYEALSISLTTGDVSLASEFTFSSIDIDGTTGDIEVMASTTGKLSIHLSTGDAELTNVSASEIVIKGGAGEIELENISCKGAITLQNTTGEVSLSGVSAYSLSMHSTTGDLEMDRVTIADALLVEATTGGVSFRKLDAASIRIETGTGDVTGSVCKPMSFSASSTSGDIRVPSPEAGGTCQVKTTTGDIYITVAP